MRSRTDALYDAFCTGQRRYSLARNWSPTSCTDCSSSTIFFGPGINCTFLRRSRLSAQRPKDHSWPTVNAGRHSATTSCIKRASCFPQYGDRIHLGVALLDTVDRCFHRARDFATPTCRIVSIVLSDCRVVLHRHVQVHRGDAHVAVAGRVADLRQGAAAGQGMADERVAAVEPRRQVLDSHRARVVQGGLLQGRRHARRLLELRHAKRHGPQEHLSAKGANHANYQWADRTNGLTPVGLFAASPGPYGTFDQAGNVWQWTDRGTWIDDMYRVLRGGSFHDDADYLRATNRSNSELPFEYSGLGFRVAARAVAAPKRMRKG